MKKYTLFQGNIDNAEVHIYQSMKDISASRTKHNPISVALEKKQRNRGRGRKIVRESG